MDNYNNTDKNFPPFPKDHAFHIETSYNEDEPTFHVYLDADCVSYNPTLGFQLNLNLDDVQYLRAILRDVL